ncbi:MAG: hypothetical protein WCG44_00555 [bacterium]
MSKAIIVNDLMQTGYRYELTAPMGEDFEDGFTPDLSPKEMLTLGVFGGKYMTDCREEFPPDWYRQAKLCHEYHDPQLNYFGVNASQPLAIWRAKGWISQYDPRGWFQWYCRYYMGRRIEGEDQRQIRRLKMIKRHVAQLKKNCTPGDSACRPVQRQALLHWAYDSRII